jgi:hypothetical protein
VTCSSALRAWLGARVRLVHGPDSRASAWPGGPGNVQAGGFGRPSVAGLRGERALAGFVAGYEVAAALYSMFELKYPVHLHGLFGAVGRCTVFGETVVHEPGRVRVP